MQNKSTNKKTYVITKVGAGHAQQEPSGDPNAPFKHYGYNDQILLDPNEVAAGKWNHLSPVMVIRGRTIEPIEQQPEPGQDRLVEGEDDQPEDDAEDQIDPTELEAMIAEVEAATGKDEIAAVVEKVIAKDWFEDGTVPKTKGKLIEALVGLQDE